MRRLIVGTVAVTAFLWTAAASVRERDAFAEVELVQFGGGASDRGSGLDALDRDAAEAEPLEDRGARLRHR